MQRQLRETQQLAQEETMLQYKQWLQEGYNKGLRGLFRSLKTSELAWERPYRRLCRIEWSRDFETGDSFGTLDRTTTHNPDHPSAKKPKRRRNNYHHS